MQRLYATGKLFYSGHVLCVTSWGDDIQEEATGRAAWYESLDFSRISDEERYRILEYVVNNVGRDKVQRALGVSRFTMWRLLDRKVFVDDNKLRLLLNFISSQEFQEVLGSRKLLEVMGVVRSDGTVNYSVVMEILRFASSDEYLKQRIIRFVVDNFREEVKKAIGLFPYTVTLHWEGDFEGFLRYEKKG